MLLQFGHRTDLQNAREFNNEVLVNKNVNVWNRNAILKHLKIFKED